VGRPLRHDDPDARAAAAFAAARPRSSRCGPLASCACTCAQEASSSPACFRGASGSPTARAADVPEPCHPRLVELLDRLRVRRIGQVARIVRSERRDRPTLCPASARRRQPEFAEAWPADGWSATIRRRVHGQRPPLGGETTVARRTLGGQAAWAPRAKGWDRQPNAAPAEKEGPISRPGATHREGATPGSPWLPLPERAAPDGSTRGDDEGQEQSPANIASWRVATHEAFRGCARPARQRSRATRTGRALAQPGRRAVLGGLGAPP
jgi:hypothetical protein